MYLFSDLGSPFGNDQLEAIIDGLKEVEIHVTLMWASNLYVYIRLRIPTGGRQTNWLHVFTSIAGKLKQSEQDLNP